MPGEGVQAAAASSDEKGSNHIWSILPSFDPSSDDPREYVDKVKFLHAICPVKDRPMLAPRLALLMKGTAWAQMKGAQASKLSDPDKGIEVLLASVATWEETAELQTYDKFEKCLYKVSQKSDETTLSYVNRLNVAFQDLGTVEVADMKAFILLRQSALSSEDKKKVISMTNGDMTSRKIEGAMRSLATKVLNSQADPRKKIYPVNFAEDDGEEAHYVGEEEHVDEEMIMHTLADQGDEDALTVQDFEEQLMEVCQESPELSLCFSACSDARQRIKDKIRSRGFWPAKGMKGGKGKKGAGKGGGKPWRRQQTLADRIASSSCRICGVRGHWKWECPKKGSSTSGSATTANADVNMTTNVEPKDDEPEIYTILPKENVTLYLDEMINQDPRCFSTPLDKPGVPKEEPGVNEEFVFATGSTKFAALTKYLNVATLEKRLRGVTGVDGSRSSVPPRGLASL